MKAKDLLEKCLQTENLIKHSYAVEAVMRALAQRLEPAKEDDWALAGLLHDIDIDILDYKNKSEQKKYHGLRSAEIVAENDLGNEYVWQAIKSHNGEVNGTPRTSIIDKALYAVDPITGFITAIALIYPDKKLSSVKVKSITKRMKEKAFAAGANREAMMSIEELGIPFAEFAKLSLEAMTGISDKLGL
ncbi:phosphohydrolase [Candidatus Epulonipiscium fishelsonii]|uniref:Phosphohydrolase n=1 Tax=Candidatus Epulonipiscium fishelsonii TaxID=77094 RepID=A0ACC8XD61_9FIRM|nr:phosphohydrolase [Epulopiscium sp. SCG-B05WGA-EpuloA1]ONI40820.1 phosphohydrolase [Epulopiscium sp. SCG-B11WGA-EpuloA1]